MVNVLDRHMHRHLKFEEEVDESLSILGDVLDAQLRISKQTIDEGNRNLSNREVELTSTDDHLHLERIALRLVHRDQSLQNLLLIQAERASQIRNAQTKQSISDVVRSGRDEFALQIPSPHSSSSHITRSSHDVVVLLLLLLDELGDKLGLQGMERVG